MGELSLNQVVEVTADDIRGGYKGPIAKKYPEGGVSLKLKTLLRHMVANSDNSASDLILNLLGGPKVATEVLRSWGYTDISIDRYEKELIQQGNAPGDDQLDVASANELIDLIKRFYLGELLSKQHTSLLVELMTSPQGHIAKGLPKITKQFHKSGWCSKSKCINDVALITLPNNKGHLAIAILMSGMIEDTNGATQKIGQIARMAYAEL